MKLVTINVKGIYGKPGSLLPASMARLTPDAAASLAKVESEIETRGGYFRLSDAYRSSAMQARAHDDYVRGRKRAYSPPAGASMHEAGRAIDLDLAALIHSPSVPKGSQTLNELQVRAIFESYGWTFIAPAGNPHLVDVKESWHIEYRGSFQSVYDNILKKTGSRSRAYHSMAAAAIADLSSSTATPLPITSQITKVQVTATSRPGNGTPPLSAAVNDHANAAAATTPIDHDDDDDQSDDDAGASQNADDDGNPGAGDNGAQPTAATSTSQSQTQTASTQAQTQANSALPHIGDRLRSSTTFLQSLGIQATAVGAAVWSFVSANTGRLLYILGGSAFVSLTVYAIYTWKEVQTKRLEAGKR